MNSPIFISVGSINVDFQCEVSEDLSKGGTLDGANFVQRAGGKGANRAFFAATLGVPTRLVGRVGNDPFAQDALAPLKQLRLDLSSVSASDSAATGISMIAVPENGEKTILFCVNANEEWDRDALRSLAGALGNAPSQAVVALDFEIARDAIEIVLDAAADRGLRVIADGSIGKRVKERDLARLYAIAPNVQEAATITKTGIRDEDDAHRAARRMLDAGTAIVCVKLSDGGCVLAHDGEVRKICAPLVDVIDKTGAGDAFTAALAVALHEGRTALDAAAWGVAASSIAVGGKGSQESYPSRSDLEHMVEAVHSMNRWAGSEA